MSDPGNWPKFVLYGDSITQRSFSEDGCWGSLLADKLQRKCDVYNRGFSGYNTRQNLVMIPRIFPEKFCENVCAVTVFLGANDSNDNAINHQQHVPLEEFVQNITKMVDFLQSVGISREKILLIGTPPCNVDAWGAYCKENDKTMAKCDKLAGNYADAGAETAKKIGVEYVNTYKAMKSDENWSRFFNDGLHFSKEGSEFFYKLLDPHVERLTQHLPQIMPNWDCIDADHPENSLL